MPNTRSHPRRSLSLCLCLVLAAATARSTGPDPLVIPLDERNLARLETTLDHLAARFKTDPALKKDMRAFQNDKELSGDTVSAVSASITRLHPKFAAVAKEEDWSPGELYLTYILFVGIQVSETVSGSTSKDAEDKAIRRNMEFYEKHKARIDAMVSRFSQALGNRP